LTSHEVGWTYWFFFKISYVCVKMWTMLLCMSGFQ